MRRALPRGSALRFATVEEIFYNNLLVRLWCFRCFRFEMMTPDAMQRSWKRQLGRVRPRCKYCRKSDMTRALPASDPDWKLSPPDKANSHLVEQFFHGQRSRAKKNKLRH